MNLYQPKRFCKELPKLDLPGYDRTIIVLALPEEQLQELVLAILETQGSMQFVRQMTQLRWQALCGEIKQKSADPRIQIIIDATQDALPEHKNASLWTPFFAAMYAYENSRDHLLSMLGYFDFCEHCKLLYDR
jgi:hypothetical protein